MNDAKFQKRYCVKVMCLSLTIITLTLTPNLTPTPTVDLPA